MDRLATFFGYAAATVARGELTEAEWRPAAPLAEVLDPLLSVPTADSVIGPAALTEAIELLANRLVSATGVAGFRVTYDESSDQTGLWILS